MKRFRSFLLFSAVAALLAFAGSAWAAPVVVSRDVLSFDVAKTVAISVDISFDIYKKSFDAGSKDILSVHLSPDKSADLNVKLTVNGTTFTSSDKVGIFALRSADKYSDYIKDVKALKLSDDTKSSDLFVAFPIVLFEKGLSGDVKIDSGDTGITAIEITQKYSDDLKLLDVKTSGDANAKLKIVRLSGDYEVVKSSDIKAKSADAQAFTLVKQKAAPDKDAYVDIYLSGDRGVPTSKDLVMVKMVYSGDTKMTNYGVFYSKDIASDIVSADRVRLYPMAISVDEYPEVAVTIYNASKDAISKTLTFTRYVMNGDPKVHFEVGGASWDKVVSFDTPSSWVVKAPVSADLEKVSGDLGDNYAKVLSGDTVKVTWYTSSDFTGTSYDFSKIVTSDLKLYGSFDAEAETSTGKTITVAISADKTSIAVGETATFKITTVSPDLTGAKYTWFKGAASTDKTSSADTFVVSSDKAGSFDVYVLVTSGDYTGSSDKVSVTVTEAASTTVTLSSLTVTVAPDDKEWDVSVDKADSIDLTMTVVGTFSDSSSKDVTSSTTNTWTLGTVTPTTSAITLSSTSGTTTTIAIAATITSGEYTVPVTAKAVSGDVSKEETVTYTIVASGSGGGTPGSDAAIEEAREAVKDALANATEKSVSAIASNPAVIAAISNSVSSGTLDMSVLNGVTSLKGLATLLKNLTATVSTLDFKSMGDSLTSIGEGDLEGVNVTAMTFSGNTNITSVNFSGATVATVTLTNSAVKTLSLPSDANVATVNAQGASDLTTVEVAGNTNIKELDIGETSVASLDVKGCTSLTTLAVDNTNASEQGSLEELDITSCDSLTRLDVQRNKLLGIKKPSPSFAKPGFVFNAGGQRRAAPSGFTLSTSMNFWSILRSLLGLGNSGTIPFTVTTTTVTFNYGGTLNNETGEVTYTTTPTAFSYSYNPGFTTAGSSSVSTAADSTMDVQIGDSGSGSTTTEAKLGSSSGGGCDAGFGFGALAALMAVFALKKKR